LDAAKMRRFALCDNRHYRAAMSLHRRTLLLAPALLAAPARAQAYPEKPIRLVVPFAPGGNADITGRLFSEALAKRLGQSVIVENRGGAGGAIGSEQVANSAPDGYSIVLGSTGTFLVSPRMTGGKPPYTLASFAPVAMLATSSMVLEVNASNAIKDWPAMLAYLKANPGKLTVGHPGNGSTNHLALLQIQKAADVRFNIVPYKSMGLALNDLLAGQIDAAIDQIPASIGHIRGGKLCPIVVTSRKRAGQLPDVATLAELGITDFDAQTPLVLMAPAATPEPVVRKLNEAVKDVLADPAVKKRLAELGNEELQAMTPPELSAFLQKEDQAVADLAKTGLLKPE
jgi:tripartite-type tricarboxylate transporter receptor subunit TctC